MRRDLHAQAPSLNVMEQLMERAEDIVFCIKNRSGQYLAINDTLLRRTWLHAQSQILGRTTREVFPALLAAGYKQQDAAVFRSGTAIRDRQETITSRDGTLGCYRTDKCRCAPRTAGSSRSPRLHVTCVSRNWRAKPCFPKSPSTADSVISRPSAGSLRR
jgi:hypothetical protein